MIRTEKGKFQFAGSGEELIADVKIVFKSFLIASARNFEMDNAEAVSALAMLTSEAMEEFLREQRETEE